MLYTLLQVTGGFDMPSLLYVPVTPGQLFTCGVPVIALLESLRSLNGKTKLRPFCRSRWCDEESSSRDSGLVKNDRSCRLDSSVHGRISK